MVVDMVRVEVTIPLGVSCTLVGLNESVIALLPAGKMEEVRETVPVSPAEYSAANALPRLLTK